MNARKPLGEILVDLKALKRPDLESVLEAMRRRHRRQKFGQVARDMGLLREEDILAALAVQMDLFPGIGRLSLPQILHYLQAAETIPV